MKKESRLLPWHITAITAVCIVLAGVLTLKLLSTGSAAADTAGDKTADGSKMAEEELPADGDAAAEAVYNIWTNAKNNNWSYYTDDGKDWTYLIDYLLKLQEKGAMRGKYVGDEDLFAKYIVELDTETGSYYYGPTEYGVPQGDGSLYKFLSQDKDGNITLWMVDGFWNNGKPEFSNVNYIDGRTHLAFLGYWDEDRLDSVDEAYLNGDDITDTLKDMEITTQIFLDRETGKEFIEKIYREHGDL